YDPLAGPDVRGRDDAYRLRVEPIYAASGMALTADRSRFPGAEFAWCQADPATQIAWADVAAAVDTLPPSVGDTPPRSRDVALLASASPATGLASRHKAEQTALVNAALTIA